MAHIANKIDAKDKKLSEILSGERYRVDSFQREYRWQRKHIEALISDLSISFLSSYQKNDTIEDIEKYDCYYMGPIVLCQDKNELSIVDGQQRLTSFTLVIIYLLHQQNKLNSKYDLRNLNNYLYVRKGGKETLVLNVESRENVIKGIISNGIETLQKYQNDEIEDESVLNILNRYQDIESLFPEELKSDDVLPLFVEWLLEKVVLVEVRAYSMENAYTIFETMNDRGMTLSPTEILKGYLLSKIKEEHKSEEANEFWKNRILKLNRETKADADLEFFRAWLRSKYAETTRATRAGAENEDFELIATQFNTWIKNNTKKIHLRKSDDYYFFIVSDFSFFSEIFINLYYYKSNNIDEYKDIYINNFYPIADSLYYPLLMASISKTDDERIIREKILLVNKFVDIYSNIRMLSNKSITQSTIRYFIYDLIKEIRNKDLNDLKEILINKNEDLQKNNEYKFLYTMNNWGYCHYFLARIKYFISRGEDNFLDFIRSRKQNSYVLQQIFEHDEFGDEFDYNIQHSSIGNYCLIRRYHIEEFSEIKKSEKKIKFLFKHNYLLEIENKNGITSPNELVFLREERFKNIVPELWDFDKNYSK